MRDGHARPDTVKIERNGRQASGGRGAVWQRNKQKSSRSCIDRRPVDDLAPLISVAIRNSRTWSATRKHDRNAENYAATRVTHVLAPCAFKYGIAG